MSKKSRKRKSTRRTPNYQLRSPFDKYLDEFKKDILRTQVPRRDSVIQKNSISNAENYRYDPIQSPINQTIKTQSETIQKKQKNKTHTLGTLTEDNTKPTVCSRRSERKEIMHALGHAGKGGQRKPTNDKYRNIKC